MGGIIFLGNVDKNNVTEVKKVLDANKIFVSALNLWTPSFWKKEEIENGNLGQHIKDGISVAKVLNTKFIIIYGVLKNKETEIDSIDNYIKRMEPIVKEAKKEGMIVVIENDYDINGIELTRNAYNYTQNY